MPAQRGLSRSMSRVSRHHECDSLASQLRFDSDLRASAPGYQHPCASSVPMSRAGESNRSTSLP
eukprot:6473118-Prymnesium_polylepis.1